VFSLVVCCAALINFIEHSVACDTKKLIDTTELT
jgi:hypothetical protein